MIQEALVYIILLVVFYIILRKFYKKPKKNCDKDCNCCK